MNANHGAIRPPMGTPARTRLGGTPPAGVIGVDLHRVDCLGDALYNAVVPHQSRIALIEADRRRESGRWTFRQLADTAARVQAAMHADGVGAGDRIAILASNQSRWLISATAAFWAGGVLVPIDYKLDATGQADLLAHATPRLLITEWSAWRTLQHAPALPSDLRVWVLDAPEDADVGGAARWQDRVDNAPAQPPERVPRERSDIACIVYSSGTGGEVKGCMLTHGNYLAQAESLASLFPMDEGDAYFSVLPTNHAIDFMCGFLLPLFFGATVVHQRTLRPELLGWTMKRYGITHMALVPAILKRLQRRLEDRLGALVGWRRTALDALVRANEVATLKRPNARVSRTLLRPIVEEFGGKLRLIFAGGAFVDPECASFFYRHGLPVVIGYGLTEAGTVLTVNDLQPFRSDTVGKPVPGVTLEIREPDSEGVGDIWVTGPTVMAGYFENPALSRETIVDGWLRTGDRGRLDASGHLKLLGRTRNMIVTPGGKNVYPEDIESAFDGLVGAEAYCVCASGFVWTGLALGSEALFLVLEPEAGADRAAMIADAAARNRRLPEYKRLAGYLVVDAPLPTTASMKIKRRALAEAIAETRTPQAITPWPS
jgi:long-chain acyl-CoA synthetase